MNALMLSLVLAFAAETTAAAEAPVTAPAGHAAEAPLEAGPAEEAPAEAEAPAEEEATEEPFFVWTGTTTVRARFQTGLRDDAAPAVYGSPVRYGLLEANERFRLQTASNSAALAGDLSVYLQTNDNSYQAIPNELYLDLAPAEWAGFNVGRRRLVFGAGFAYNPMDWLNLGKDPLNPLDQRLGAYLALAELHGANWAVTGIYAPDVAAERHGLPDDLDPDSNVALVRAYALVAESDINVQAALDHDTPRLGASFARYFFDVYEGHFEVSTRQGNDAQFFDRRVMTVVNAHPATAPVPTVLPPSLPPLMTTPFADDDRWFTRALVGTRYTLDSGDMLTLEYLWNGEGLTKGQWNERIDFLRRVPGAFGSLLMTGAGSGDPSKKFNLVFQRRNYLFVTATARTFGTSGVAEDLSGSLGVTANLDAAASALVYPSLSFRRGDHARLSAGVAVPVGSPTSEFGSLPFREQYVFETSIFF